MDTSASPSTQATLPSFLGLGLCVVGSLPRVGVVLTGIGLVGVGVAFITTPCMPLLAGHARPGPKGNPKASTQCRVQVSSWLC